MTERITGWCRTAGGPSARRRLRVPGVTHRRSRSRPGGRLGRLAVAVALAGAVTAGLAACQVQPGAAGFVGDQRITQTMVNDVFDSISGRLSDHDIGAARQQIAQMFVVRDLARRVAREQGVAAGPTPYGRFAQSLHLPVRNAYARLDAETETVLSRLVGGLAPVTPGEPEYREIFASRRAAGIAEDYATFRGEITAVSDLGGKVAVQRALNSASRRYEVQLNPRYGEPVYPLPVTFQGSTIGTLPVRLGDRSPKLVVAPSPEVDLTGQG